MTASQIPDYLLNDLQRIIIRIGANQDWYKQFWMGVPIWQLPEDLIRLQQIIFEIKPKWIIETGTKFGGSAIFFSSILKLIDQVNGGVITVDIQSSHESNETFKTHPHADLIKQPIIGDAATQEVIDQISLVMRDNEGCTMVFLDDNHNAEHVLKEMLMYEKLVTPGSYLIVADTVFEDLAGTPVGAPTDKYPNVKQSNPRIAVNQFLEKRDEFTRDLRFMNKGPSNFTDGFLYRTSINDIQNRSNNATSS
jgi:cephalosporin hydroxylase